MEKKTKIKVKKPIAIGLALAIGLVTIIFVTMLIFNLTDFGITIASFVSTVFMILTKKKVSRKQIFGSYLLAGLLGFLFSNISEITSLNVAMAAVSSVLAMTLLGLQHPPAIGMSVALVLNKFSFVTDVFVLFCIIVILGLCILLREFVRDPNAVMKFVEIDEGEKIKWNIPEKEVPAYLQLKD
ncbi:MAG: hypothetical protein HGA85_03525 [Nanoarchaeota archaeon]|nr:hypothetical protein [Nanoarchaeota archaeon]